MFSFYLSNNEQKNGKLIFGGYNLAKFAAPGSTDESIFWANMAHKKQFFWTVNMGDNKFSDGKKLDISSKFLILDSGLSYALIPSQDFQVLTNTLSQLGVTCAATTKAKDGAQANASDCTCKDYNALPSLQFKVFADSKDLGKGKPITLPREVYMKNKGNGKCNLLLNPNDMQIGARYGENYWIMGDQFMQAYYTIYDHQKNRVGLVESANTFESIGGPVPSSAVEKAAAPSAKAAAAPEANKTAPAKVEVKKANATAPASPAAKVEQKKEEAPAKEEKVQTTSDADADEIDRKSVV